MKFKDQIDQAYSELGFVPINGQDIAVNAILTSFLVDKKKNVILSADTGTGKSIIGAVVAKVFSYMFEEEIEEEEINPAIIAVHSNSLVKQYTKTFDKFSSKDFHQILGASNYKCEAGAALSIEKNKFYTGEDCFKKMAEKNTVTKYCESCEYNLARSMINKTDVLITNYSYYFISKLWSQHLKPRKITVFDEAHTINDVFCDHTSIFVSVDRLESYIDECAKLFPFKTKEYVQKLMDVKSALESNKINESNYVQYIRLAFDGYKGISSVFEKEAKDADIDDFVKFNKIGKKYFNLGCKIGDLFTHKFDHVFEAKVKEFSIKPIFVGKMSSMIMSDYNLFMSATISPDFMNTTLKLDSHDTAFICLDPVYDPANKSVYFIGNHRLNKKSMEDQEIISELQDTVKEIVASATEDNLKGLMLTPSFAVGELLSKKIGKKTKVFLHKSGIKADDIVREFKAYSGPSVLISPSIYEGIDFPDDMSRYQIIVKAPYPSLGEKRMKYIADNYGDIYRIMTIKKIIQGIGRSIRNKDDYAMTFVLDKNAESLFKSSLNVWKKQFNYD